MPPGLTCWRLNTPKTGWVTLKMITIRGAPSLKAWAISIYRSFRHFFEASSPEAIVYTKEVVEDLFKQLDLNGDGKVTSDEFSKKEVDTAIAKASRAAHADDRWHQIEKFITGSSRSQIISNGCLSEIIGKTHLRWYSLSIYLLDAHLSCSVVQALAKLAMDKAFDFQELRKPGDTDLVAIDRVFEKCRICKEHQGNRSYHLYTAWTRWKWDGSLLQNKKQKKTWKRIGTCFFPHFHETKRAAPLILVDLRPILRLDSDHDDFVSPPEFKDLALRNEVICYIAMEAMAHLVRWFTWWFFLKNGSFL